MTTATAITITRDSGYVDRFRDYRVYLNGTEIGRILNGQTKSFEIEPGEHKLALKIDWCGSNAVPFSIGSNQSCTFVGGSSLRGLSIFLSIFYAIFAHSKYLWLKQST